MSKDTQNEHIEDAQNQIEKKGGQQLGNNSEIIEIQDRNEN